MDYLELFKDKKIYHVSHTDLDGISCRVIAEHFIKPIAREYIPLNTNHGDDLKNDFNLRLAHSCDYILFTDLHPNLELYNQLKTENVFIFDHHQTARDELGDLNQYEFHLDSCGAKILYDSLTLNKRKNVVIDQYINLVNVYDLWDRESPHRKNAVNLHHTMYGYVNWKRADFQTETEKYENFIHIQIKKFEKAEKFFFTQYEIKKISDAHKKLKKSYEDAKKNLEFRIDGEGNNYLFTSVDSKMSLVSDKIMVESPDKYKYIILQSKYAWSKYKKYNFSLRSPNRYDVRYIAEKHGGGGHEFSAGIEMEDEQLALDFISGKIHLI